MPLSRTQAHIGTLTSIYDQNTRYNKSDNFIYKTDVQISGQGKTLFTYYIIISLVNLWKFPKTGLYKTVLDLLE